jgi:Zn-dependent protease
MAPRPGLKIGRIIGIPIYLHSSWVIIFFLITLSLAMQFAQQHPHWSVAQHWAVGLLTSLLFFGSVIFHELSHSVVAKHYKIPVISITLFIFGGVARIGREPSKASQEFNIAAAGPLASFFLYGVFRGLTLIFPYSEMLGALAAWLAFINVRLAVFNLIPGFPLDGGRIFRAIAWGSTKNYLRATQMAGASGKLVAYTMILMGAWAAFHPDFIFTIGTWIIFYGGFTSGLWTAFLGWFLLTAAQESVAQVALRENLSGLRAADVMSHEVPTVLRDISLEEYSAEVLRTGRRCHLVLTDDRLVGMMNVHTLNSVPRSEWQHTSVQAVMIPRERILWASPDEPLLGLLERLLASDVNQMPVVENSANGDAHIIGMVTRDSILRVVQTRTELRPLTDGVYRRADGR